MGACHKRSKPIPVPKAIYDLNATASEPALTFIFYDTTQQLECDKENDRIIVVPKKKCYFNKDILDAARKG